MTALKFSTVLGLLIVTVVGRADPFDTWTQRNASAAGNRLDSITYGNGQFVAVGGGNIVTSSDAVNWVVQQESSPSDRIDLNDIGLNGIAYGVGQFVAVGYRSSDPAYPSAILTSTDGTNWVHRQ